MSYNNTGRYVIYMTNILLDTNELQESIDEINRLKSYFSSTQKKYSKYKYGDNLLFSNAVDKVNNTCIQIYGNLAQLENTLKDYKSDVENLEKSFAQIGHQPIRNNELQNITKTITDGLNITEL